MRASKRFGSIVLALTAVFAVAAQPAAAGKKPKPKPDFAVKSVTFLGETPYYIVLDRTGGGLVVNVKVKNQGKATADGDGTLTVQGLGALRSTKFKFEIPKLKPGETDTVQFDVEGSQLDGITTYTTKACASAKKDSKSGNDCRTGPEFAAIPRTWTGRTNGTWTDGLVTHSLVSNNATFTFDPAGTARNDVFTYLGSGSVTATITGDEDPFCTMSGTGDAAIDPSQASLVFEPDLTAYRVEGNLPDSVTYTAYAACEDNDPVPFEQIFGIWVASPRTDRDANDEVLAGTQNATPPDTWSWNLHAE